MMSRFEWALYTFALLMLAAFAALWVIGIASLLGCAPVPIAPQTDSSCGGACAQIRELGCHADSPNGVPCERWCADYHALEYMPPWGSCAAAATDRDALVSCGIGCP